jgi:hypothetical protein
MSQRGAETMAGEYEKTYDEILKFYYPGMTLEKIDWTGANLKEISALPESVGLARARPTPRPTPAPLPPPNAAVVSDALKDDREFDDLFDAEARAGAETPRLSSVFESLDAFWERVERRLRFPAYVASVLAQAVALVDFSRSDWTLF